MTNDLATVRPLPRNTIIPVAGVSFRQNVVMTLTEGDPVRVEHDTGNEHDSHACAIYTDTGTHIGYVPKSLAYRLSALRPGGTWRGSITEVLRGETWGVRVRLDGTTASTPPALTHRRDDVVEHANGTVALTVDVEQGGPPACKQVFAKSGRLLGTLDSSRDGRVTVVTSQGRKAVFPEKIVRIAEVALEA